MFKLAVSLLTVSIEAQKRLRNRSMNGFRKITSDDGSFYAGNYKRGLK